MLEFRLPDLGEGLTEAQIVTWLVRVGDIVTVDQPVVEVETAKAAVEIPVPFAGAVTALHGDPGQVVGVGRPLLTIDSPAEHADRAEPAAANHSSGPVLVGYGPLEAPARRRPKQPEADRQAPERSPHEHSRRGAPAVISPLVRRLAREHGVDLSTVHGSGPDGMVLRRDLEQQTLPAEHQHRPERQIPLVGVRKTMADRLSRSRREIPEATVWVDVDASALLAARKTLHISLMALFTRFAVLGLRRYPELNARVDSEALVVSDVVNVGLAAQTPRGLVVPVIHHAETMTTSQLSDAVTDMTAKARAGTLSAQELTGGTVTVNNYGTLGVDGSAAIINYPEVAIIGIGRIIDRPWVIDGELAVRQVGQLTLAFDHRACDGGTAGGFLRFLADCVENPVTALTWL